MPCPYWCLRFSGGHAVPLLVMLSEVETSLFLCAGRTRHAVSLRCHIDRMGESLYSFIAIKIEDDPKFIYKEIKPRQNVLWLGLIVLKVGFWVTLYPQG